MQYKYRKYTLQASTIHFFLLYYYVNILKEEHILIVLIDLLFLDFDITSTYILIYFSSFITRGLPFVNLHSWMWNLHKNKMYNKTNIF